MPDLHEDVASFPPLSGLKVSAHYDAGIDTGVLRLSFVGDENAVLGLKLWAEETCFEIALLDAWPKVKREQFEIVLRRTRCNSHGGLLHRQLLAVASDFESLSSEALQHQPDLRASCMLSGEIEPNNVEPVLSIADSTGDVGISDSLLIDLKSLGGASTSPEPQLRIDRELRQARAVSN